MKPFWAVMASAYTELRDHFYMPDRTLRSYLENVSGFVGIPGPKEYLTACGISIDRKQPPLVGASVRQDRPPNLGLLAIETTTVTGIINFCQETLTGYAIKRPDSEWPHTREGENTMAVPIGSQNTDITTRDEPTTSDPLFWTMNPLTQLAEDPRRVFAHQSLYDESDRPDPPNMAPPGFVPPNMALPNMNQPIVNPPNTLIYVPAPTQDFEWLEDFREEFALYFPYTDGLKN